MKRALLAACLLTLACACTPEQQAPPPPPPAPPKPAAAPPATVPAPTETAPAVAGKVETDDWNLPGGLGPLTTRLQLDARFGRANVQEASFAGAEGIGTYLALVVFPEDARRRLELVLDADNPDAPIRELRVRGQDSQWRLGTGLRPGMTLAEVVALNGAPVSFYGLGWDHGGTVQDWHGGALANAVGNPVFHRVTLSTRDGAGDAALPTGDATFRSDDPRWPSIGADLVVSELGVSWPNDGD